MSVNINRSLANTAGLLTSDVWTGFQWFEALQSATCWFEQHVDAINALNVFPVPDGDTGTNMWLTLAGALEQVEPDSSCAVVADRMRYWATMRGRGNSGIILSQVLRGFAIGLTNHEHMGAGEFVGAMQQATKMAYKAVIQPVEGTMLTVVREASDASQGVFSNGRATLEAVLHGAFQGARDSVARTPMLLKVLSDAGVVDAGGQGVMLFLEGLLRYARGEVPKASTAKQVTFEFADVHGPDAFGYCTNFVLHGVDMPYEEIRSTLAVMGQSVVIVGDAELIKAHLHLLRPGDALNYAGQFGSLSEIEITNMDLQREAVHVSAGHVSDTQQQLAHTDGRVPEMVANVGVVAVVSGNGFDAMFRSLYVGSLLEGGQSMNPSTAELLEAIERLPQSSVVVLPNNRNIILAAQQAARMSTKQVEVLPSKTIPQGIAAMVGFSFEADLADNIQRMSAAMSDVCTAEITTAVRDATINGLVVTTGQIIGLLDSTLIAVSDDLFVVLDTLLDHMDLTEREVVALYYGQSSSPADADVLSQYIRARFPDLSTVEMHEGGQLLYDYILSAE
ncbi:MAG: DAK2 domain-containing protein [Chloroflexi bacterium AL-W]|nr:DAK2 domain-containing protein [Chloroflexi bacterium AL-N1]NOK67013.1 DAK2 domain-containing protein [Chloroflexi bacterium AL-N10]NOK74695.1 DAK2 domain-containing protein [Chloroflexi bacterium AL-N5]NOK81615.1 DAK2 domain-containing protein [Chloroflexi bacterium AL-W]NOK89085.1 DAK2 domain-containing protein [Chloroflexi bacterium AL-N15]